MRYEIECYIETIDSEGCFTFHGSEGFCLEKGGTSYNVLWPEEWPTDNKSNSIIECLWIEQKFSLCKEKAQDKILLLVSAKANHSKVKLVFVKASKNNHLSLKSLVLI